VQSVKQPLIHSPVHAPEAVREGEQLLAAMCPGELPRERLARLGPQALKDQERVRAIGGVMWWIWRKACWPIIQANPWWR